MWLLLKRGRSESYQGGERYAGYIPYPSQDTEEWQGWPREQPGCLSSGLVLSRDTDLWELRNPANEGGSWPLSALGQAYRVRPILKWDWPPWCVFSISGLLLGLLPLKHGVILIWYQPAPEDWLDQMFPSHGGNGHRACLSPEMYKFGVKCYGTFV
jgi:hypothetical protein